MSTIEGALFPGELSFFLPEVCISPRNKHGRFVSQLGCVQSLLPLHSAVSYARLTSYLGIDSRSSRSLAQGLQASRPWLLSGW
nr:protein NONRESPONDING TO OXYLIPINS 2, mitochondrial-like [Ziziphus jujuba var. spinosa]